MQPKEFLHTIVDELGRSFVLSSGNVTVSTVVSPLLVGPDGWQDTSIRYARNMDYMSQYRTFTNPFKYVLDAAKIVRNELYRRGPERKIYQVIHKLDKSYGGGWKHKFMYKGQLDLTQVEDNDSSVTVNVMEGGLVKLMKANEATTYEIPVDVPEAVIVKMDGHYLNESLNYLIPDVGQPMAAAHLLYISFINQEGSAFGVAPFSVFGEPGIPDVTTSEDGFMDVSQDILNMNLRFKVAFTVVGNSKFYQMDIRTSAGRVLNLIPSFLANVNERYEFDIDFNFDAFAGERFFLTGGSFGGFGGFQYEESDVKIKFKSRFKTTYIKALRANYIGQFLLDKITGGGYVFNSNYLGNEWSNLLMTCGDGIRGIAGAVIKISWKDFFDSYNVPCNIRYGIRDEQAFIEKKAEAFLPTIQHDLGSVSELSITMAKDFIYNTFRFGYPNTDTDDVNGKDEFNVSQTYTSPVTSTNKQYEMVSKAKASMYTIELIRINLEGKTTTDDDKDGDPFFLHVEATQTTGGAGEPATYYKLLRNTYDSVSGLLNPETAFNVELHPELCLKRHGNMLRSILYWLESGTLDYQTSDKNGNVKIVKNGSTYVGDKHIVIGSLDSPLFIPLSFKVSSVMSDDILDKMDNGPDGTFLAQYGSVSLLGFPTDVGFQPANNPAQDTTLLCSPLQDLTQLIAISRNGN